jgi:hypothetical protein
MLSLSFDETKIAIAYNDKNNPHLLLLSILDPIHSLVANLASSPPSEIH